MSGLLGVVVEGSRYLHLVRGIFGIERRWWSVLINGSGRWLKFEGCGIWVLIMMDLVLNACTGWRFNGITGFTRRKWVASIMYWHGGLMLLNERRRVGFGIQWRRVGKIQRVWGRSRWLHVIVRRFMNRDR